MILRTHFSAGLLLSTIILSACSGGNGGAASFQPGGGTDPTPPPPSGPVTLSDIEYGKGATTTDDVPLLLDIYQPTDACSANRPTILYLHGGGFIFSKDFDNDIIRDIAAASNARDLNFVAIEYRTLGNNPVPSPEYKSIADEFIALLPREEPGILDIALSATEDTVTALRWMETNADTYCLDMSRLAFWGESSGATTAMQTAYGLNQYGIMRPGPDVVIDYWGNLFRDTDLEFREAPFLTIHGTADQAVAYQNALDLTARGDSVGVPYAFYTVKGADHTFLNIDVFNVMVDGQSLLDITLDFIEAHLIGGTPTYETVSIP